MLAIKLQRIGKKHQPSYRVVVAEKRSKLNAPPVEDLGSYNAFTKTFAVKADRVKHWLQTGATPTATVHNLFVNHKVVEGKKIKLVFKKKEGAPGEAPASTPPAAETPVAQ